jgi:hypothetical protein
LQSARSESGLSNGESRIPDSRIADSRVPIPDSRVQRPESGPQWQTTSSDHFEVFYQRELAGRVRDLIWEAERAYSHLTEALQYDFSERVPLIFVAGDGDVQDAAITVGDAALAGRQRIVISANSLDRRPDVMIHELTHQFAFVIVPDASRQAPWLIEGLAEHQRGVWDDEAEQDVRDAVAGGWIPDVDNLASADRDWTHAFFDFIADAHGSDGVRRYLFVLRKQPQATEALRAAFDMSPADLNRAFRAYVTTRFGGR